VTLISVGNMEQQAAPTLPPKVLIVNDQEWSARSVESIFAAEGYTVLRAFTGAQALVRAAETMPDVFILDRQLPDVDGVEICRRLRADPRYGTTTPIIITTAGQAGRAQRLEAYAGGAWDFIGQPIDGETLLLKVRTFLEAKRSLDTVRSDAFLDEDTGLYTRRGLALRAREIASEAGRRHQALTCIVFSPEAPALESAIVSAESLVAEIGNFFRSAGRAADAVGRLGPLEFGVIAPATSQEGAAQLLERLETTVANATRPIGDNGRIKFRAGYFGTPDFAESAVDPLMMIERAGAALRESVAATTRE
jgi:PleD family two-component response regulator